ncbi:MAG: lipopolysaccharide heptosyltransferase I [Thermodesulfobacteria bacterium]|nr:lipopolysaccharide heptosyltransferase I [Thermodesulfobacteriota bacterium]
MKILLVKLSSLGDVIQALPVLSGLKAVFPEAEIDWVVEEPSAAILRNHPLLRRLLVFRRPQILAGLKRGSFAELRRFLHPLREETYDVVLDLQGLLKSGLIVGVSRGRCKVGFANHREGSPLFYNLKLPPYDPEMHAVRRYLSTLRVFGLETPEAHFSFPPLPPLEELRRKFALPERFAVLVPVARWPTKLWTTEGWQVLAQRLKREGIFPVIVGAKGDASYARKILAGAPGLSLCGETDLLELATLLRGASVIVSVDTGPMHLAAALGKPVVALFGPTAPWRTGPYGEGHRVIFKGLSCSPCFKRECASRRCLTEIAPEEVLQACGF